MKYSYSRCALALVLCFTMMGATCNTSWISQAEEIVAALVPAAANVLALVAAFEGKTISGPDLLLIQNAGQEAQKDLQQISALIQAYQSAEAGAKPGILSQITTIANLVQQNLTAVLPALHIKDAATFTKITAVIGIVISEVQSLAAIIPIVTGASSPAALAIAIKQAPKTAPLSGKDFRNSFNAVMHARTGSALVDNAAAGLKI